MSKDIIIDNFKNSLTILIDGYKKFKNSKNSELKLLLEGGCIQRFEYTLERA